MKVSNNKVAINLLVQARKKINMGHHAYVCLAINHVCDSDEDYLVANELASNISALLEGKASLQGWLHSNGHITRLEWLDIIYDCPPDLRAKLKQTRLNWIDWMISELKVPRGETHFPLGSSK